MYAIDPFTSCAQNMGCGYVCVVREDIHHPSFQINQGADGHGDEDNFKKPPPKKNDL